MSDEKNPPDLEKMDKESAKRVLEEVRRRARRKQALDPNELLFGPQRAFATQNSRAKAACCGRRSGKTYALAYMLLEAGMRYPRSYPLYVTMARSEAKRIIWEPLHYFNDTHRLGLEFKQHTGEVHMPNGSIILLQGANSRRDIDKGRGKKYPIVVIDEAQSFPHTLFDYMIDEVFEPATVDYQGTIVVTGTPNASCTGPFHDIATGISGGWHVHNWTMLDNTEILRDIPDGDIDTEMDKICERRGWDRNHPGFLREYMGKWVRDENDLVFSINTERNTCEKLPAGLDYQYVLGVDLGFNDPCAFVVLAYSHTNGYCYVVESYKEGGLSPSDSAVEVEKIRQRYPIHKIVADTGGIGKGYVEEWRKYGISAEPAAKGKKVAFLEFMNGDLRSGALKLLPGNEELLDEMTMLQWDPYKMQRGKFDFDKKFADHLCDALLYGWRECKHHTYMPEELPPQPGSKEWYAEQEKKWVEEAIEGTTDSRQWWQKLGF